MRSVLFALLLGASALAPAADLGQPLVLVATPGIGDENFGGTILVVKPVGADQHLGFIVNRPTEVALGALFPGEPAAQKVTEPVYVGGPLNANALYALVRREDSPGGQSLEMLPGLYAAFDEQTVDRIIENEADHARFVVGMMAWGPGELAAQVEAGAWYVLEGDAKIALRQPEGLWESLVRRMLALRGAI
ncbi:MAG TPA: YqgE/AlgH family protein [Burkholderiales bacterium]|nr:YqgE/AlgH family protein [Burkholderiales bacterium]